MQKARKCSFDPPNFVQQCKFGKEKYVSLYTRTYLTQRLDAEAVIVTDSL